MTAGLVLFPGSKGPERQEGALSGVVREGFPEEGYFSRAGAGHGWQRQAGGWRGTAGA